MNEINIFYKNFDLISIILLILSNCLMIATRYYQTHKRGNRLAVNDCNLKEILGRKREFTKVNFDLHLEESSDLYIPIQTIDLQGDYVSIHARGMLAKKAVGLKVLLKKDFKLTPFYTDGVEQKGGVGIILPHNKGDLLDYTQKYSCHMPIAQNGVVFCIDSEEGNTFVNVLADFFCYAELKQKNQTLYNLCFDAHILEIFSLQDNSSKQFDYNIVEQHFFVDFNSSDSIKEIASCDTESEINNIVCIKLFCTQKQGYYSEMYLNIDLENKFLIFKEKDPEYTENLIHSFFAES